MKKIYLILCSSALVLFSGCNKESVSEVVNGQETKAQETDISGLTLAGTLENVAVPDSESAKTTIGEIEHEGKTQKYAVWSANDTISVFDENGNVIEMKLKDELSPKSTKGIFVPTSATAENFGTPTYAVYPSSLNATIAGTTVSFTLPATQYYAENTFADGSNVAVSVLTKNPDETYDANFRNVCGYLKLQLKGDFKVGKIKVSGHNDEKLNGKFNVDLSSIDNINEFKGAVATSNRTKGDDVITLDCTRTVAGGVQLNTETAITFYVVVPVNAFAHGFAVRVYDAEGTEPEGTEHPFALLTTTTKNVIERSHIKAMPEMTFGDDTPRFKEVEYLENTDNKNNIICTNINAKSSVGIFVYFEYSNQKGVERIMGSFVDNCKLSIVKSNDIDNKLNLYFGGNSDPKTVTMAPNDRHSIKVEDNTGYVDNNNKGNINNGTIKFNEELPIYLFSVPENKQYGLRGKVYSAYITDNHIKVRDFIPCCCISGKYTDGDGNKAAEAVTTAKPGMLDLVSGKLFINIGTSTDFKFGPYVSAN